MRGLIAWLVLAASLCAQPRRIVSTAPSITETLFALGLGDAVVGVSQHCHYPPEAAKRPRVGAYLHPNVEAILALRPDLVIVQDHTGQTAAQLRRVGIATLEIPHGNLETLFAGITAM